MIRTQIQLPEKLHRRLKQLAEQEETSLAEIIRRASERELAAHPEPAFDGAMASWQLPAPRLLGIRAEVPVTEWREIANEPEAPVQPQSKKRRR